MMMNVVAAELQGQGRAPCSPGPTLILVEPIGGGWCVSSRGACEAMVFLSGGRAEAEARLLARCLALVGHDVLVEIHDRTNRLAGRVSYSAEAAAPGAAGAAI
jgi:hypothetical protein